MNKAPDPNQETFIIHPITGEKTYLRPRVEQIDANLEAKRNWGKPNEVWSSLEFAEATGLSESGAKKVMRKLHEQANTGQPYIDYLGLQIPSQAVVQYTTDNNANAYGIQQLWGEKIAKAYKVGLPEEKGKPEDIWSSSQLGEALNIAQVSAVKIIRGLQAEFASGKEYVEHLGLKIPSEAIVKYRPEKATTSYGIQKIWGEKLVQVYKSKKGIHKGKPAGVWSSKELATAMGLAEAYGANFIRDFRNQFAQGQPHANYLDLEIPPDAILKYRTDSGIPAHGIQQTWGERVAAAYKARKGEVRGKPEGIWSADELAVAMSITSANPFIKTWRDQFESGQAYADYLDLEIPSKAIVQYTAENGRLAYGVQQKWGERIAGAYKAIKGEERGKPADVWLGSDLAEAMGLSIASGPKIISMLRKQLSDDATHMVYLDLQIPSDAIVEFVAQNGCTAYGLQETWGRKIAETYKATHGEEWEKPPGVWSGTELSAYIGVKNSGNVILKNLHEQQGANRVYRNLSIPQEALVLYSQRGIHCYGIKTEWGNKIAETYLQAEKPEGFWSMSEFAERLGGRCSRVICKGIRKKFEDNDTLSTTNYRNVIIPREAFVRYFETNSQPAWSIRSDIGQQIVDSFPQTRPKSDDIWSAVDLGNAMGLKGASRIIPNLKNYFDSNTNQTTASIYTVTIPKDALIDFDLRGETITGIKKEYGERIAAAYKSLKTETKPIYQAKEFAAQLGVHVSTATTIIETINQKFIDDPTLTHIDYLGIFVPKSAIVHYTYNNRPAIGITPEIATEIAVAKNAQKAEQPPKPDNVWSSIELARKLGIKDTAGHTVIAGLVRQVEDDPSLSSLQYGKISIPRDALIKYYFKARESIGIREDAGALIVQEHNNRKGKPADTWSGEDFNKVLGSTSTGTGIIAMIRKQLSDPSHDVAKIKGVQIPRDAWIQYEHGDRQVFGVQEKYALKLLAAYGVTDPQKPSSQSDDRLRAKPIEPRVNLAHQTEEERAAAKRSTPGRGEPD